MKYGVYNTTHNYFMSCFVVPLYFYNYISDAGNFSTPDINLAFQYKECVEKAYINSSVKFEVKEQ